MKNQKKTSFAPLILVALGIIFLLNNFGLLPWNIWLSLWRFWPVLLILIGLEIFFGRSASWKTFAILFLLIFIIPILLFLNPFGGNPFTTSKIQIDEELAANVKAKVTIDLPAVNLKVSSLATDSSKLVQGTLDYSSTAPTPLIAKNSDQNTFFFNISQPSSQQIPLLGSFRNEIKLSLSNLISFDLALKTAAANMNFDLSGLNVENIQIESTAGNLYLKFPSHGETKTTIKAGASSVTLEIPNNLSTKIKITGGPKNISFPKERFEQKGEFYQSKDFDKAKTKTEIEIQIGAGNITIR